MCTHTSLSHAPLALQLQSFSPPLPLSPTLLREAYPYSHMPPLTYPLRPPQVPPLSLDLQAMEPPLLLPQQASPTRARSPDVISSASTAMSQDIPEIASEALRGGSLAASVAAVAAAAAAAAAAAGDSTQVSAPMSLPGLHGDSMASAASALHMLSPRNRSGGPELGMHPLELGSGVGPVDVEQRLSNTPSLLENALSQENAAAAAASCADNGIGHAWPAAPDITRETRQRDNGMGDWLVTSVYLAINACFK